MTNKSLDDAWVEIDSIIEEGAASREIERWAAFRDWAFAHIFGGEALSETISETDLVERYTRIDGKDDLGIDGFLPSDSERAVALFQSKDKSRVTRNELKSFLNAPQQVLLSEVVGTCDNDEVKYLHTFLKEKLLEEYWGLKLVLATSGRLDARAQALQNEMKRRPRIPLDFDGRELSVPIEIEVYDRNGIAERYLQQKAERRARKPNVELPLISYHEFDRGGLKTITAHIPAKDLVARFRTHGYTLFDENLRKWLGKQSRPYLRMLDTLRDPEKKVRFHLLNNGLSALCEDYEQQGSLPEGATLFLFSNFQIVNGCQTTVFLAKNFDKVDDTVFVSVRVTQAHRPDIAQDIAEATNTQAALRAQDFRSNDRQQRELKEQFERLGWFYEIKTGEWDYDTPNKRPFAENDKSYRRLSMKDVAQAALAFIGMPGEAVEDTRTIFENKEDVGDSRRHYEDSYPLAITAEQLLLPSLVRRRISSTLKGFDSAQKDPFNYGELYILWLIAELLRIRYGTYEGGFLPVERSRELTRTIEEWFNDLFEVATEALDDKVTEVKEEHKKQGSTFNQRNFYRSRADTPTYNSVRNHLDRVLQRIRRRPGRGDPLSRLP